MARFLAEDCGPFQRKVVENYHAGQLLYQNNHYNAAATRLYYTFVLLGLRNAAMYSNEISEDLYIEPDSKKIAKKKIKDNARGLKIANYGDFIMGMNRAESARVKADYSPKNVTPEEIEGILPKLESVLDAAGVTI